MARPGRARAFRRAGRVVRSLAGGLASPGGTGRVVRSLAGGLGGPGYLGSIDFWQAAGRLRTRECHAPGTFVATGVGHCGSLPVSFGSLSVSFHARHIESGISRRHLPGRYPVSRSRGVGGRGCCRPLLGQGSNVAFAYVINFTHFTAPVPSCFFSAGLRACLRSLQRGFQGGRQAVVAAVSCWRGVRGEFRWQGVAAWVGRRVVPSPP